jgi:hypothetical protein
MREELMGPQHLEEQYLDTVCAIVSSINQA